MLVEAVGMRYAVETHEFTKRPRIVAGTTADIQNGATVADLEQREGRRLEAWTCSEPVIRSR